MNRIERHLPRQVDAFKLAQQGVVLEGSLAVSELPRLAALLSDSSTVLHPVLSFAVDEDRRRTVKGSLHTTLSLVCQRCLEAMNYDVVSESHYAFVTKDEQAKALPDYLEPVMLTEDSSYTDLYDMLEDELLLSLPISAFHEHCEGVIPERVFGEIEVESSSKAEPLSAKSLATLVDIRAKLQGGLKKDSLKK